MLARLDRIEALERNAALPGDLLTEGADLDVEVDVVDALHRAGFPLAEASVVHWEGIAWSAAIAEAKAHIAGARGRTDEFGGWIERAATLFAAAGQPLDAARCRTTAAQPIGGRSHRDDPPTSRFHSRRVRRG